MCAVHVPVFDIALFRIDRSTDDADALFLRVDWPCLPHEGEDLDAPAVESAGYDLDGYPLVNVGRVVLDDFQVAQMRKGRLAHDACPT